MPLSHTIVTVPRPGSVGIAQDQVVSREPMDGVVAQAAQQDVGQCRADDRVVTRAAYDGRRSGDHVIARIAVDHDGDFGQRFRRHPDDIPAFAAIDDESVLNRGPEKPDHFG